MTPLSDMLRLCHAPGVYFNMPAEEYHKDPSIGSTDIRALREPHLYQLASWMNNYEFALSNEGTMVGTALHTIVLEGNQKFFSTYVRRPPEYDNATQTEKTAITKSINARLAVGQILLPSKDYRLCLAAAGLITRHADLSKSLAGGCNEVSIFWIDATTGVPCKGRYDRLKERGIGDIKTMANERRLPTRIAAQNEIKSKRYDMQAAHYLMGATHIGKHLKDNAIFGPGIPVFLERIATNIAAGDFGFQFIFLQKSVPGVWSGIYSPQNTHIRTAMENCITCLHNFKTLYQSYGHNPWPETWGLGEIHPEDMGEYGWY